MRVLMVSAGVGMAASLLLVFAAAGSLMGGGWHGHLLIGSLLFYEMVLLAVSGLVAVAAYGADRPAVRPFLAWGRGDAPVGRLAELCGFRSWRGLGLGLLAFLPALAAAAVYLSFYGQPLAGWDRVLPYVPWILLFAALNALGEEVLFRLVPVALLAGRLSPSKVCLVSAVLFALPQYFGTPGGGIGVMLAGVTGWWLARALLQTRGLGWPWGIHFVQDTVIFLGVFRAGL